MNIWIHFWVVILPKSMKGSFEYSFHQGNPANNLHFISYLLYILSCIHFTTSLLPRANNEINQQKNIEHKFKSQIQNKHIINIKKRKNHAIRLEICKLILFYKLYSNIFKKKSIWKDFILVAFSNNSQSCATVNGF